MKETMTVDEALLAVMRHASDVIASDVHTGLLLTDAHNTPASHIRAQAEEVERLKAFYGLEEQRWAQQLLTLSSRAEHAEAELARVRAAAQLALDYLRDTKNGEMTGVRSGVVRALTESLAGAVPG